MRRFLSLLERRGPGAMLARDFEDAVPSEETRDATRAAALWRDAPRAREWPCDEPDCARAVVERKNGKLVAVCTRSPAACEPVDLRAEDLAQVRISADALVKLARRLLAIDELDRPRAATEDPAFVGLQPVSGQAREVWLALRPWAPTFPAWLAERDRGARPVLVLLPTGDAIDAPLLARHAPGAHVEIEILADTWSVRAGRVERARRLRVATAPAAREDVEAVRVPRVAKWRDAHLHKIDEQTILVRVPGVGAQRLTYLDLGMAWRRNRRPKKIWLLLMAILEDEGTFRWRAFGDFDAVTVLVSDLRKALKKAFRLKDDPFEPFSHTDQWRTKFHAHKDLPRDLRNDSP